MEQAIATSWSSYPHIWALGHANIKDLFLDPVVVQEKVDGSQLSWGVFMGEFKAKSRGADINVNAPPDLFKPAIDYLKSVVRSMRDGITYRGEAVCRTQHNTIKYSRAAEHGVVLFDANENLESYLSPVTVKSIADDLGIECVPTYFEGMFTQDLSEFIEEALQKESFLGGAPIEGVVFKNYQRFGIDKKALMGKYVSEIFKEQHKKVWKQGIPMADMIGGEYRNDARWEKAIQHLRDAGQLTNSPQDIGPLLKEIQTDLLREGKEEIKERLFNHFWRDIGKRTCAGFPEYYKKKLMEAQPTNDIEDPEPYKGDNP